MFQKIIVTVLSVSMLMACATTYQSKSLFSLTGGYYDEELPNGYFIVGFDANGFTYREKAVDFALLRCADLAISKEKEYFEIIEGTDKTIDSVTWDGYSLHRSTKPGIEYVVRFHEVEPVAPTGKVFNADSMRERVLSKYYFD